MQLYIVPTSTQAVAQSFISYVVPSRSGGSGAVALDAGCLTSLTLPQQRQVEHVVLTHCHLDHVASLALLIDNTAQQRRRPLQVYGLPHTLAAVQRHVFNDEIWPNLARIAHRQPLVQWIDIAADCPVEIGDLVLTAVPLDHVVPTVALVASRAGEGTLALVSDTGPTHRIWERLAGCPDLSLLLLEASFPTRLIDIAQRSGHLCPAQWADELAKLSVPARIVAVHLKPPYHDEIRLELAETAARLGVSIDIGQAGQVWSVESGTARLDTPAIDVTAE